MKFPSSFKTGNIVIAETPSQCANKRPKYRTKVYTLGRGKKVSVLTKDRVQPHALETKQIW